MDRTAAVTTTMTMMAMMTAAAATATATALVCGKRNIAGDNVEEDEGQDEATQHRANDAGDGAIGHPDDAGGAPGTGRG